MASKPCDWCGTPTTAGPDAYGEALCAECMLTILVNSVPGASKHRANFRLTSVVQKGTLHA
ncbi:MAG TPA: hypothetical protein VFH61_07250 [Thermoleophilia bacterium]|nr:hypothetical protein [Thermoleophilia bacterium]